jgi:hypothetical protein
VNNLLENKINEKISQEIIGIINGCLPKNAKLLFLSLTGSRAFGWASDNQDYDVHGVFLCDNYWDWVHVGRTKYDINLYEFNHLASDIQIQHFEQFMNWSNPFYVDSKFDLNGLMSFCTLDAVKQKQGDIEAQINRFKFDKAPRTALHAYRILMVPLYFIENRKFELNIFKINEKFNFQQLGKLKDAYNSSSRAFDITKVNADLDYLVNLYKQKLPSCTDKPDMPRAIQWMNNVKALYEE